MFADFGVTAFEILMTWIHGIEFLTEIEENVDVGSGCLVLFEVQA